MKRTEKTVLAAFIALSIVALAAVIYTRSWSDYGERLQVVENDKQSSQLVDTHPLDTAHELAPLAVTSTEQDYAREALRLGDHAVDLAFDAAMRDATENPTPLTSETRNLASRVKKGDATVAADQARVAQLTQQLAQAGVGEKDVLQEDLGVAQAQLALDQDELEDAHQDLIRMGGDKQAVIQQLIDQHEASETHIASSSQSASPSAVVPTPTAVTNTSAAIETSESKSLVAQAQAWWSLRSKEKLLTQAQLDALVRMNKLAESHEILEKNLDQEKTQKIILHKGSNAEQAAEGASADSNSSKSSTLSFIHHLTQDQKSLSEFDKRIGFEKQLGAVYGNWIAYIKGREKSFLHGLILGIFWVLLVGVLVFVTGHFVGRIFEGITLERRELLTIRAAIVLSTQVLGILLVLLVVFGMPSNLATVLALAGAGLTVTMKDFIVGFFGWFVLMGRNGIRPGDWVEINGVGGEVIAVGLLHTVLMETGSWSDAGHPTGRKVSFVNSYAIEGHYFNFSTSGQWLWDQIEVQIPDSVDPYRTAEAIQKIAVDATAANVQLAEEEWQRVTPSYAKHGFSATPSMGIQPAGAGIKVLVRYLTRANERHEVRAQIYRAVVDLLHKSQSTESAAISPVPQPAGDRS